MITRELKIGDKIKCIKQIENSQTIKIGTILTFKELVDNIYRIGTDIYLYRVGTDIYSTFMALDFINEHFELVEEEKK